MTNLTLRMLPLTFALALAACGDKPSDNDDDTDDTTTDTEVTDESGLDTDDSGGGGGGAFEPIQFSYSIEFAIAEGGSVGRIGTGDQAIGPVFTITMEDDGGDTCSIFYVLDDDQYGSLGQAGDSDTPATGNEDVISWLEDKGADFGFQVLTGHYTAVVSTAATDRCDELTLDYVNALAGVEYTDLAEAVLQLGAEGTFRIGLNESPSEDVITGLEGSGITEDQTLGGFVTFPFALGSSGDTLEAFGIWTDLDENGEPASDGTNLILNDAADAFNDGTGLASPGYYRGFSLYVITFSEG